jgi:hypothetical protein
MGLPFVMPITFRIPCSLEISGTSFSAMSGKLDLYGLPTVKVVSERRDTVCIASYADYSAGLALVKGLLKSNNSSTYCGCVSMIMEV